MKRASLLGIILIVIIGVLAITQLVAQDDDSDDEMDAVLAEVNFLPIDTIVDTDLIVTNFSGDTATLPIETSVSVACTMVYGTTPEFGNLTLDQDMDGGTHSSHNPLLSGLEPETLYYFRVQGVDEAGNMYISEVMTFTTPPADEDGTDNLLSPENGAEVVGVSSNFGGAENDARWGILSAFDNNLNSAWASDGDGDDAWFEVQLDGRYAVNTIEFQTRLMNDGTSQILEFTITTDSGEVYGPFEVPEQQVVTFDVAFEAEFIRFDVTDSSGGNTGIDEIALYGEPVE